MKNIFLLLIIISFFSCKEKVKEVAVDTEMNKNIMEEKMPDNMGDWINLFDGTSFENWRGYLAKEAHPEWTIEDGAMAFNPGKEGGKNIISKEKYTNFILSLEWKISEGGNSGIFWGVFEDAKYSEAYQTGPEIQVLDNEKHPDAKVPGRTHTAGSLYDMIAPPTDVTKPAGEWNVCIIEVNHKTNLGKVSLNEIELFSFPAHGEEWNSMVANSKFKDWEGFGKYQTGHIGLQDHGDKVWYRNIKIKKLDD